MHIPDGFLSTPVWATLDVAAIPAVSYVTRRAQIDFTEDRIPLLGVMGAFVFAAQMINFPVGIGTSSHLVGGALLVATLGPAAASLVMTAILLVQALVFQDGGILALGANVLNMAIFGVWAAYLPIRIWPGKRFALFLGGFLSVLVSALMALSELLASGVKMPSTVLGLSLGWFVVSSLAEGAITVAVIQALTGMNSKFIRKPSADGGRTLAFVMLAAILLAVGGVLLASTQPDGIGKLAETVGIAGQSRSLFSTPLASYEITWIEAPWLRKGAAGVAGLAFIYVACMGIARIVRRADA